MKKILNISYEIKYPVILAALFISSLLSNGCKEEIVNRPQGIGEKPSRLDNVTSVSGAGKSTIRFRIEDERTLYVLAEYEIRPGVKKNSKSSKYKDELILDGFAREGQYAVTLYAVAEGEVKSDPLDIKVEVGEAPVMEAFHSLNLREDFGGMNISFENENEGDLAIDVLTQNEYGSIVLATTQYSSQKNVSFSVRGFSPEPRNFYVVIRDRWENQSDTSKVSLTPLYEELLDRTKMKDVRLPTDTYQGHTWSGLSPREIRLLFDGNTTDATSVFHIPNNSGVPMHFTIDLGAKSKLSRFKIWMRNQESDIFNSMSARLFEVYGSNDPNQDGSWESWTLLDDYEMEKPSGLPRGELSAEDRAAHAAGIEFSVSIDAPSSRYLRFRIKETWGLLQTFSMAELAFWGVVDN